MKQSSIKLFLRHRLIKMGTRFPYLKRGQHLLIAVCLIGMCLFLYIFGMNDLSKRIWDRSQIISGKKRQMNENSLIPIENYYRYPCIPELDINGSGPCARTICTDYACGNTVQCTALPLKTANNMAICTYDPNKDVIAKAIKQTGSWEDDKIRKMMKVLQANTDMVLVDIGCNIGVYTLVTAWMSKRAICIDANYENIRLVHTSLALNNLTENVTLVWNALSYERRVDTLKLLMSNIGASRMQNVPWWFVKHDPMGYKEMSIQVIKLDDMQSLVGGHSVFMKLDIEEYELNALRGGREFLKNVDVRYIQVEFYTESLRLPITQLLSEHGFAPYRDIDGTDRIKNEELPRLGKIEVYFIRIDIMVK